MLIILLVHSAYAKHIHKVLVYLIYSIVLKLLMRISHVYTANTSLIKCAFMRTKPFSVYIKYYRALKPEHAGDGNV